MTARIIDGKALAESYRRQIAARVDQVRARGGRVRLDAVLVGSVDSASHVYASNQGRTCAELGIEYKLHALPDGAGFDDIAGRVLLLNTQDEATAIMVHVPLPDGIDPYSIQRLIAPEKDVEGVNPANIGNIVYGRSSLAPCTALATVRMIDAATAQPEAGASSGAIGATSAGEGVGGALRGKVAVCIGAGDVVGKPIAVMLMRREATVVSCNKWSPRIKELANAADILVAAAGVPGLITAGMVKPRAIVVDVGVSRVPGPDGKMRTVGDVAFEEVKQVAGWVSPVPGGVGPMTVAMLLLNVVEAAERVWGVR
ncbi:MAG: bifunctional 5,10-methylenetetrahydrofolate dehydrogenase/5,10-methenyltetrahydrofolate cyclohydrolase [Phycisphaeraceae bacterium]|nr:bifunctional 5,10-methylenetetrahydrofolate dehydrogenase/5,10-methenyltetrahydrofolate cyclohydrolase [Phycisphaeraceae bacterium]